MIIGGAAVATAPDPASARAVQSALASLPPACISDPAVLAARLPVRDVLGPATLAYLPPPGVRPVSGPPVVEVGRSDRRLLSFLADADLAEAGESGLTDITSPAFAVIDRTAGADGAILSAAGYQTWPNGVSHLCVLTGASARGHGLARAAASAATGHAMAAGLLPQWRARLAASRSVACSLGFTELGSQVSLRIAGTDRGPK